jgi:putative sigma-54 modulation protein
MRIELRGRGVEATTELRERVERRLLFAVGRFGDRVHGVSVRLVDANGPRGGVDKACRVRARVRPLGSVTVEERDTEIGAAIDRAMDRVGRTLARELERQREGRAAGRRLPVRA